MSTSTQLVLPKKLASSVKPQPTKTEIIEALARRLIQQQEQERIDAYAAADKQEKLAKEMLDAYAKEAIKDGALAPTGVHTTSSEWQGHDSEGKSQYKYTHSFSLIAALNPPDRIVRAFLKARDLKTAQYKVHVCSSLAQAKREIRAKMEGARPPMITPAERVNQMLTDPAAVKGLDAMLKALSRTLEAPATPVAA